MAESFENLDTILRYLGSGLGKDMVQKSFIEALNRYESLVEGSTYHTSFLENDSEKIFEQSQSTVERD